MIDPFRLNKNRIRSWFTPRTVRTIRHLRPRCRLYLEVLEDRVVPATVTWDGGAGTFNWKDALNWSTDALPGADDDVTIDVPEAITVTHSTGTTTIKSLLTPEALTLTGGSLTVLDGMVLGNTFSLAGGTLRNTTVRSDNGATMVVTSASGTLDGVTLGVNTTLQQGATGSGNQVTVVNGLNLASNAVLRLERPSTHGFSDSLDVGLNFSGDQVLGGTGSVELFSAYDPSVYGIAAGENDVRVRASSGTLTIGPGITVRNATSSRFTTLGDPARPLVVQGKVSAQSPGQTLRVTGSAVASSGTLEGLAGELDVNNLTGNVNGTNITNGDLDLDGSYTFNQPVTIPLGSGSLTLRGTWTNGSTITQSGGTIHLGATFRVSDLGAFMGTGGTVSIFGTLDDPGTTLTIDAARQWQLAGGAIRGVTLAGGDPTRPFQVTSAGGTLDGVTLGVNTTLQQGATGSGNQVTVVNGLSLASNAVLRLERPSTHGFSDSLDVGLNFSGDQVLGGTGSVELFSAYDPSVYGIAAGENDVRVRASSGTLTIGPGITVRNATSSRFTTLGDPARPLVIQGTVSAQSSNQSLRLTGSSVTNIGILQTSNNGTLQINQSLAVNGSGILAGTGSGVISTVGNLTGDTTKGDLYNPTGTVRLDGSGTAAAPQLLEAMSRDLGNVPAGFRKNFAYGTLALAKTTYVRLVDLSDNAPGAEPEAVYVNSLLVPAGTTLDLNGLHVYVRAMQVAGTVTGGTVTWVPDGDTLTFATPTPGAIGAVGEVDQWQLFGRGGREVTVVVNPGSTAPAPLTPRLSFALVQVLDSAGNILASGSSPTAGAVVTLRDVRLPSDGICTVRVGATTEKPSSTGNYLVTLWDSTADTASLTLGQRHMGNIETPFSKDRWTFSAAAGQQVRFDLLTNAAAGTTFTLTGPDGFTGFTNLTDSSGLVTLTQSGAYTLTAVAGPAGLTGVYAFGVLETSVVDLTLGASHQGLFTGSGQAQLFRVNLPTGGHLRINLDDASDADRNEVYVKFGVPPTRSDYQYRFQALAPDQQVLAPQAAPGTWYVLVYSATVPSPSPFTITAQAGEVMLASVTPDHHGNGAPAVVTVTGAGFRGPMSVELVAGDGTTFPAATVTVDLPTQSTATFAAGAVPAGVYTVRARLASGATSELPVAFRVEADGEARLETNLVLPSVVGRHALGTIYVEYANTGTVAMPAPLLVLRGSDKALMTLDQSRVVAGFWTSSLPEGFGDTVQILGSGATPGVLQPGEHMRVPVYYAGLLRPWDLQDSSVEFHLEVLRSDNAAVIDWNMVDRPTTISPQGWDVIRANLQADVGATWGDYVRMLDDNASYLGHLGERVIDVGELWSFEMLQASGLSPVSRLAAVADAYVDAPGMPITFSRLYSPGIDDRFELGVLGRGWSWADGWIRLLTLAPDGSVIISAQCGCGSNASRGSQRVFKSDYRFAAVFFSQQGDNATVAKVAGDIFGGIYELREASGLVTRFRSDGRVDYVRDHNGNRITATWENGRLTRLTHSAGQFLQISYNADGLITGLLDSTGRSVVYTYDASNEHLLSVTGSDGQTTQYGYSTGAGAAQEHALVSVGHPDGTSESFTYDAHGRLTSVALDGNAQRITFAYSSAGRVTATNAVGGTSSYFFDHRGRVAVFENALGGRTVRDYDGLNLTHITDALGQDYTFAYDGRGNVIRSTDPLGHTTTFTYTTNFNRLATVTDARGNPIKYGYDSHGNLASITYADNSVERFTVDAQGNLDASTNRRGQVVDASYDSSGRLLRQDFPDGSFVEYRYNSRGNLDKAITQEGTTQLEYADPQNPDLVTKISYPNGRSLTYTYDHGRRASLVHPDGFTVKYLYDSVGRLQLLRDGGGNLIVQYGYDAAGRLVRRSNGNGTYTEYEYDLAGQILHLVNRAPDGGVNSRFDYVYDALGRRTRMTTLDGVWDYTYDRTSQLTHAVFTSSDPASIPNQDLEYVYDAVGNRVRTVINGVTTEYTTNKLNQYTQVGTAQYTYDLDGNLVARVDGAVTETFTYDAVNRLVGVATPDGTWGYGYDAFGNRSATVQNGQRKDYLVDPFGLGDVVAEYTGGGAMAARYVHAFSNLVSRVDGSGAAYYDFDALGSTVGMTSGTGSPVNRYSYLPFGDVQHSSVTLPNPFTFIGNWGWDPLESTCRHASLSIL